MWRLKLFLWRLECLRNRVEWALNQRLLGRPGYAACDRCRWIFPISKLTDDGLCPGCAEEERQIQEYEWEWSVSELARQERDRQIQKEVDAAWAEEERRRREEIEKSFREAQSQGLL